MKSTGNMLEILGKQGATRFGQRRGVTNLEIDSLDTGCARIREIITNDARRLGPQYIHYFWSIV